MSVFDFFKKKPLFKLFKVPEELRGTTNPLQDARYEDLGVLINRGQFAGHKFRFIYLMFLSQDSNEQQIQYEVEFFSDPLKEGTPAFEERRTVVANVIREFFTEALEQYLKDEV